MTRSAEDEVDRLHSAGGVVARPRVNGGYDVALMRSRYGTWVFPKGRIEPGETSEQAARRELREEVGLDSLTLLLALPATSHEYKASGRRFHKQVEWFLFLAPSGAEPTPNPTEHALEAAWFEAGAALSLLSHRDQRNLLRRALKALRETHSVP